MISLKGIKSLNTHEFKRIVFVHYLLLPLPKLSGMFSMIEIENLLIRSFSEKSSANVIISE